MSSDDDLYRGPAGDYEVGDRRPPDTAVSSPDNRAIQKDGLRAASTFGLGLVSSCARR